MRRMLIPGCGRFALSAWLAAGVLPASALAAPKSPPLTAIARLQGQFLLAGRVTVAKRVRGEHPGEKVARTWTFTPGCAAGPCATVKLTRARAGGSDKLVLRLRPAGYYSGEGSFYAPLRCGKKTYHRGELVPFTIIVSVTAATVSSGVLLATQIRASYSNRSRTNLTPCFAVLGHDAASYRGRLVAIAPARGAPRLSGRSLVGS